MQESVARAGDEIQRSHGIPVQVRVGLNSGDVVIRSIGKDLRMDYTAVGQTTYLAGRLQQMARPGSALLSARTLQLAESYVQVKPLGPGAFKGLEAPVEVHELAGARSVRSRLQAIAARSASPFVGRDVRPLYEYLVQTFGEDKSVQLVLDRRRRERRQVVQAHYPERRIAARRRQPAMDEALASRGLVVVRSAASQPAGG
jgi:Adenylate and Guanylate cyclase catalytic domain